MQYQIRKMSEREYGLLEAFLYEAIFVPAGVPAPPREIIRQPELQVYIADFGRKAGDCALAAEADGSVIGAVWVRIMDDYGHIDDETPSLAISVQEGYRGSGIGTALMQAMLAELKRQGVFQASLSVQKENRAVRLYQRLGFGIVSETEEEYIMLCRL
ncbi:MAG: GNAT family N-acetyltransferase [Oscillospiraceae bacterium]|nr:GNAT family N-acetyltransferase [Oscillospiraceae bacterium]